MKTPDIEADREEEEGLILSLRQKTLLVATLYLGACLVMLSLAAPAIVESWGQLLSAQPARSQTPDNHTQRFILKDDLDNLDSENSNWFLWEERAGRVNSTDGYVLLKLERGNSGLCLSGIADRLGDWEMKWLHVTVEIRLRCGDDNGLNSDSGEGHRGWGLGDVYPDWPENFLIFNSHSPGSDESLVGFYAYVGINGTIVQKKNISHIDMRQWHTYTIIWRPGNATFLVDDETVFTTEQVPSAPLAIAVLTQSRHDSLTRNGRIHIKESFPLKEDQWIQIDHIHVYLGKEEYTEYSSKANQTLREAVNTINSARLGGIDTKGLVEDHTQATQALDQEGYIPAELYLRMMATATKLPNYLDELSNLFAQAEEKIQDSPEKETRYLELQVDKALEALRETRYTLATQLLVTITEE